MTDASLRTLLHHRTTLKGQIEQTQRKLAKLLSGHTAVVEAIRAIEAVAAVFPPERTPTERGRFTRMILNAMRGAAQPMTARQIAVRMMETNGADTSNAKAVTNTVERVRIALCKQRQAGMVVSAPSERQVVFWEIAR